MMGVHFKHAALCLFVGLCWVINAGAGLLVPADPNWQEAPLGELPPPPQEADLIAFMVVDSRTDFYVDAKSIKIGSDDVVRYTMLARGQGGAVNLTYEGIRCATSEGRLYAAAGPEGRWRTLDTHWSALVMGRPQGVLARDFICDGWALYRPESNIVKRLRAGVHAGPPS